MINKMIGSVSGKVNTSGTNLTVDSDALFHADADNNIAIGIDSLDSISGNADNNIGIGKQAGTALTTGDGNVLIGYNAGDAFDTEDNKIAIGSHAMGGAGSAAECISIGKSALSGAITQDGSIAIGHEASKDLTGGIGNIAIGYQALLVHTEGNRNIAIGYGAMDNTDATAAADGGAGGTPGTLASSDNLFIGYSSGGGTWTGSDSRYNIGIGNYTLNAAMDDAFYNTTVGYGTLSALTVGDSNTAIGYAAGNDITTGSWNIFGGGSAGEKLVAGQKNIAMGYAALATSTDVDNTVAIGYYALGGADTTSAADGTVAIGMNALAGLTTGVGNIALGYNALNVHTLGERNIAIGYTAMHDTDATHTDNVQAADITSGTTIIMDGANTDLAAGQSVTGTNIPTNAYIASVTQTSDPATFELSASVSGTVSGGATLTFSGALASKDNVFIGYDAGGGTWGSHSSNFNTAIGSYAMNAALDESVYNTGVGYNVFGVLTEGNHNTAIGSYALDALTTSSGNTAIGYGALSALTIGTGNVVMGYTAMNAANSTESHNVAIGYDTMGAFDENGNAGDNNIAIGRSTLLSGAVDGNTTDNIAIGSYAMDATSTHAQVGTIAIGRSALGALTTGSGNVAIGYNAMQEHTTGGGNTVVGYEAMNQSGGTNASVSIYNTFMGYGAGGGDWADAQSNRNTVIGFNAMNDALSGASNNVGLGDDVLGSLTSGDNNTIIGSGAGDAFDTESGNVAVGSDAFSGAVDGAENCVALGRDALKGAATQDGTIAIGYQAGAAISSGLGNIAIGRLAMLGHTTGGKNIAIGYNAMDGTGGATVLSSVENIFIGYDAGGGTWTTAASNYNVGVGNHVMDDAMNGSINNTGMGHAALGALTTGDSNTCFGYGSGGNIVAGSTNTNIGAGAEPTSDQSATTSLGYLSHPQNQYETRLGYHGGLQFYSRNQHLTYSDAIPDTVAITSYAFKIPARSIIKSITAVVTTLSDNTVAEFNIVRSTDNGVSAEGEALSGTNTEILGAGAAGTTNTGGFNSGGVNDIVCDIADEDGILNASWHNSTIATLNPNDASTTSDSFIWVQNAIDNGNSDPSTAPVIRICIEFVGQD